MLFSIILSDMVSLACFLVFLAMTLRSVATSESDSPGPSPSEPDAGWERLGCLLGWVANMTSAVGGREASALLLEL